MMQSNYSYYVNVLLLCWMALAALSILVHENSRITRYDKKLFYLTYGLIALSSLAELGGVLLDGRTDVPRWALAAFKCLDYVLSPLAGGALVAQMKLRNRWNIALIAILVFNTVFQLLAVRFGWSTVIDAQNRYSHGPLFPLYLVVCASIAVLVGVQFYQYSRTFRRYNRLSLYAIMLLLAVSIAVQEVLTGDRTVYLGLTLCAALMFIHYSEYSQLASDDFIARQQAALDIDPLTGLLSRYAYTKALGEYDAYHRLPDGFAAFSIDINGLKNVNDNYGHGAGDELIRGAALCIARAFSRNASCFRIGGDEFVVFVKGIDRGNADFLLDRLRIETEQWQGDTVRKLRMSAGYALKEDVQPDTNAEKLVSLADQEMYRMKADYYRKPGKDRRRGQEREQ